MEPTNSGPLVVALQVKKPSFLDDEVQLKKLSRHLSRSSSDAVDVLVKLLENADDKIKMQAAVKLLEFDLETKKSIAADQLQRMIADIKIGNSGRSKELELEDDRRSRPVVDFTSIREL